MDKGIQIPMKSHITNFLLKCLLFLILLILLSGLLKSYYVFNLVVNNDSESLFEEIMQGPLRQDDPRIVNFILDNEYIRPPPSPEKPYNLVQPYNKDPSMGQAAIVQKILQNKRNGFFIECGALDGETRSNTLWLERNFQWKGLLIEGDPLNYKSVLTKNRRAWTAGCCLSIHPYPHKVWYQQDFNTGVIRSDNVQSRVKNETLPLVQMQCFPLISLLQAMDVTEVDYLSLDVEGNELDVLQTIDFDLITIKILSVEFSHGPGGAEALESFMGERNYRVVTKLTHQRSLANDLIFVHQSVPTPKNVKFPQMIKSFKL